MKRFSFVFLAVFLVISCFPLTAFALTAEEQAENEALIFSKLYTDLSLSEPVICGILANIYYESGYDPSIGGDYNVNTGEYTSFGLCQWHGSRWDEVVSVCEQYGYDPFSLDGQCFYIYYDLNNTRDEYYSFLLQVDAQAEAQGLTPADVAYQIAYWWCTDYEVPANKEVAGAKRGVYAAEVLLPKYYSGSSEDFTYEQVFGDGDDFDAEQALNDAFNFLDSIPGWIGWLPDRYAAQLTAHFTLIIAIAGVLITLKVIHG